MAVIFYRDCYQHLKQQPVYLAISHSVARWEWECPGRERKHQGRTWRQCRVEATNFPQEDSDEHTSTKGGIQNVYTHTEICTCIQPHTLAHTVFDKIPEEFIAVASSCKLSADQCVVFSLCRISLV